VNRNPYNIKTTRAARRTPEQRPDFDQLEATELYCPQCRKATPVKKSLLLVLPEGDKYQYRCQYCGTTVGDKIDRRGTYRSVF
jgi:hypothetical protein